MTNLLATLASGLILASAPLTPVVPKETVTVVTTSTVEYTPLSFARCEIRDPKIGFYGKGNCDKLLKAYAEYKQLHAQK